MKTKQLNVRLSETAWNNLASICQASGINQTAAVEIALAALLKTVTTKGNNKMDTQKIMDKNSKVLRDFFAGIASGNYWWSCVWGDCHYL